ncbi:MAG: DUF695 domain-containing protein [Bacteroidota bacterium]
MKKYKVLIPEEKYQILEFRQDNLPGIVVINSALKNFEPKEVFAWHCSIIIEFEGLIENGMPAQKEQELVDQFGDDLDTKIKGPDKEKPNALFLGRITWNKTRELIWRVFDPEITNNYLSERIEQKDYPREFDYRIENDPEWKLASWHLMDHHKNS